MLLLYTRSCGACKSALAAHAALAAAAAQSRARAVFARHEYRNEWDDVSDLARLFKCRHAPAVLFLDDGAIVRHIAMRDLRSLAGSSAAIQAVLDDDAARLRDALRQVLCVRAPGARP